MLRVQDRVLGIIRLLKPVLTVLARKDGSLENQLRRAAASIALNLGEGFGSQGGIKKQRYRTALGSLEEVCTALQVAIAFGYLPAIDAQLANELSEVGRIIGALAK